MTEETELEGKQDGGEIDESSQESSSSSAQPSEDFAAIRQELAELKKLYTGIQKGNDKVNARVEQKVNDMAAQIGRITELAKAGKTPAEIEERLLLDDLLAERKGNAPGAQQSANGAAEVQAQELVKELGLDANDKDVAEAVASGKIANVIKIAMSKAKVPEADATTAPPLTLKEVPPGNVKALSAAYDKAVAELRGERRLNPRTLANLKSEYRKKGLNIW